jgi:hypothetical protein
MAMANRSLARRRSMSERANAQQKLHFPEVREEWLWHRTTNDGYTTVPRTLPLAMQAIDSQSKGHPAGHTLFCLWARAPDASMLVIESPAVYASEAGFSGLRAIDTWRRRMKTLQSLGFLHAKAGVSGDFHYVLLVNPNVAIEELWRKNLIQEHLYHRFIDRVVEVGAGGDIDAVREIWREEAKALEAPRKKTKKKKVADDF